MDIVKILQPFFSWLLEYFGITITLGGFSFTVGALYMWLIIACILIGFLRGLAR